jgi:hypothetical protein
MEGNRVDAPRAQLALGEGYVAHGDQSVVGDQQRPDEPQLTRQESELPDGARTEH